MWRMSANSIATTSATPLDLLQAYRQDEEEFYGLPEDEELTVQLSSDEDEDELSSSYSDFFTDFLDRTTVVKL